MKADEMQGVMQDKMADEAGMLLEIRNLKIRFAARKKVLAAVDDVSLSVRPGEVVGVVGEPGSDKGIISQSILCLRGYDSDVNYEDQVLSEGKDLLKMSQAEMRGVRGNRIAVIFQDPVTSLSPVHTIGRQLSEVLILHKKMTKQQAKKRCGELLHLAGIPNPQDCMTKYPCELPGGIQQGVMIAMTLSCEPKLLTADEPTTTLDVTIQEQILNLVTELDERMGMSVLFITHDLGAMAQICHSVHVMYLGNLVEETQAEALFARPLHLYTRGLLDYIPRLDPNRSQPLHVISSVIPPLSNVPGGCRFCTRCPYADQHCMLQSPPSVEVYPGHKTKCWEYVTEQEMM